MMLLARRNNSVSNWLNSWFNDNFFDTSLMPRMNATALQSTSRKVLQLIRWRLQLLV